MATWIDNATEEFGKPVAESKLETKVRSDLSYGAGGEGGSACAAAAEAAGAAMAKTQFFLSVIRPLQKIIQSHAEIMVDRGFMTPGESVNWINLHWELLASEPDGISGGGAINCYGRERRTRVSIGVKNEARAGYTRMRLKALTFILARSGAAEDEQDLDDVAQAGLAQRLKERRRAGELEAAGSSAETAADSAGQFTEDFSDFLGFGAFDDDEDEGDQDDSLGEDDKWIRCEYDPDAYQAIGEALDHEKYIKMARAAADVLAEESRATDLDRQAQVRGMQSRLADLEAREEEYQKQQEARRKEKHSKLQRMAKKTLAFRRGEVLEDTDENTSDDAE